MSAADFGRAIGNSIQNFANYTANAASKANGISSAAQSAQGAFNQGSANLANQIGADRIAEQYAFNSSQAAIANEFTQNMWNQAAAWNEEMMEKQMQFNSAEAQKNRDWQQKMMETAYQRAVTDMEKAGLNPILAVTGGGISAGSGSGSAASVGGVSMSSPSGTMASGGLMNGISASESSYTGQMEYMGGMLGLLSAAINGVGSALTAFGGLGEAGEKIAEAISDIFKKDTYEDKNNNGLWDEFKKDFNKHPAWFFDHRIDM